MVSIIACMALLCLLLLIQMPDDKMDMSYLAPDCFHFSTKGHKEGAVALWNNMVCTLYNASNLTLLLGIRLNQSVVRHRVGLLTALFIALKRLADLCSLNAVICLPCAAILLLH